MTGEEIYVEHILDEGMVEYSDFTVDPGAIY
jgi:hypothetical protein